VATTVHYHSLQASKTNRFQHDAAIGAYGH